MVVGYIEVVAELLVHHRRPGRHSFLSHGHLSEIAIFVFLSSTSVTSDLDLNLN
ncbi:hypothetical protein PILCRDRAFT_191520 [Piloderma croceum F 1598]|uniref:Uncharacterized protein n=1 Tax=Piloderma croceum (strain F 1598) TaxID=765440 RepID=A0A0C3GG57_PILCF|nr:hypothetical protein PILCRDRAFT_191520 [Piloderma croceum F 1598]